MKIRPCKNRQNINVNFSSCRCADWFCYYDEEYHVVRKVKYDKYIYMKL